MKAEQSALVFFHFNFNMGMARRMCSVHGIGIMVRILDLFDIVKFTIFFLFASLSFSNRALFIRSEGACARRIVFGCSVFTIHARERSPPLPHTIFTIAILLSAPLPSTIAGHSVAFKTQKTRQTLDTNIHCFDMKMCRINSDFVLFFCVFSSLAALLLRTVWINIFRCVMK